jgi:hypothetical protein
MPITISGSGTIDGINTGGLPDGCIATADLANNAVTSAKIGTTEQSQVCKAWVNFNGTTVTPSTIRASYNVSSITRTSQGNYTVNLTASLVDANAAVIATTAAIGFLSPTVTYTSATASSCSVTVQGTNAGSGVYADAATVCVAVFR